MTLVEWDPRLETGIDVIDSQHRALFEAINHLAGSFKSGQALDQSRDSLAFLAQYSLEHFQIEERFMRSMNYPDLASHRVEHARLVSKLQTLQEKQNKGYLVTAEVATFVADWLRSHILVEDMGYVRFTKTGVKH